MTESKTKKQNSLSASLAALGSAIAALISFGCKVRIIAAQGNIVISITGRDHALGYDVETNDFLVDGEKAK